MRQTFQMSFLCVLVLTLSGFGFPYLHKYDPEGKKHGVVVFQVRNVMEDAKGKITDFKSWDGKIKSFDLKMRSDGRRKTYLGQLALLLTRQPAYFNIVEEGTWVPITWSAQTASMTFDPGLFSKLKPEDLEEMNFPQSIVVEAGKVVPLGTILFVQTKRRKFSISGLLGDSNYYLTLRCRHAREDKREALEQFYEAMLSNPGPYQFQEGAKQEWPIDFIVDLHEAVEEYGGSVTTVEQLVEQLRDESYNIRFKAVQALGILGPLAHAAVPDLEAALKDDKRKVRKAAKTSLARIRSRPPIDAAPRTVGRRAGDYERREPEESSSISSDDYAEPAGELLDDDGGRNIAGLQDPDWQVRKQAALDLAEAGDEKAIEALIKALGDPHKYVRGAAARSLGEIGATSLGAVYGERAVEPLIAALGDQQLHVRASAAEALGKMGDKRAAAPLRRALKDRSPVVRKLASEALQRLRGQ